MERRRLLQGCAALIRVATRAPAEGPVRQPGDDSAERGRGRVAGPRDHGAGVMLVPW